MINNNSKHNNSNYNYSNYYCNLNNIDSFIKNKIVEYETYEKKHYFIVNSQKQCQYYLAYLNGISCYLYFTKEFTQQKVFNKLYLITKKYNNYEIKDVKIVCDDSLFNGTLIKGVLYSKSINNEECLYFQYEQLIFYKLNIFNQKYDYGLNIYIYLLKNYVKYTNLNNNFINLRLPLINYNYTNICNIIDMNKYQIRNVVYVNNYNKYSQKWANNLLKIKNKRNLIVKPNIQNDIYELYYIKNNNEILLDNAYIKSYEQSVLLNSIFRNIKENVNLDLLEESDDEEEFENINIDKFVNLNKKVIMECQFNERFKKWMPIKLICDFNYKNKDLIYTIS